uniref:Uncharacterized protein n=1 Tax=uncultured marine virus TaxID=186617 RepID=A0A0F7L9F8_9VIRU|nr:hypothetical protein [uncultured marine virus]
MYYPMVLFLCSLSFTVFLNGLMQRLMNQSIKQTPYCKVSTKPYLYCSVMAVVFSMCIIRLIYVDSHLQTSLS